ncbi:MAG: 4'-phosphopantetheinyl transferase superfamily protein [Clostridia bacterium]|nr:4'-phosphopantetheinyl transferase superfamily protein [Clostridia bacterium]
MEDELQKRLGFCEIKRTPSGKPYVEGNPIYFSVTHTKGLAAVAFASDPVGIDAECLQRRLHGNFLFRVFPESEIKGIKNSEDAIIHYTVREAFAKMTDAPLLSIIRSVRYEGGKLYVDGGERNVAVKIIRGKSHVLTLCAKTDSEVTIDTRANVTL